MSNGSPPTTGYLRLPSFPLVSIYIFKMNHNFHFPLSLVFLIPDIFILYHCEFSSFSNFSSLWPTLVSTGVGVQLLSPHLGWHRTMPATEVMSLYHLCPQSLSFLLPWSPRPWVSGAASVSAETFLCAISLMFTLMFLSPIVPQLLLSRANKVENGVTHPFPSHIPSLSCGQLPLFVVGPRHMFS